MTKKITADTGPSSPDHIGQVTQALWDVHRALKTNATDARVASEHSNALGKILKGRTSQLEYYNLRKEKPFITFWHEPGAPQHDQ